MSLKKVSEKYEDGVRIGVYRVRKVILGKYHRGTVQAPTKEAAQALYKQWLEKIALGDNGECMLHEKLDEYARYAEAHKSPLKVYDEKRHLGLFRAFFPDMPLSDFKRRHVEDYIAWRKKHRLNSKRELSDATINRDRATLHYFFNWCISREYYTGNNPAFGTHLKERNVRVVWLMQEQHAELFEKASDYQRRFLYVALYSGMRHGEICGLKWSQVDLTNKYIHLEAHETKGKRRRDIPIPDVLADFLRDERSKRPFDTHVVMFEKAPVKSVKKSWMALRDKLTFAAPDGSPFRFHDLRHCYATALLMAGASLSEIQILLGHTDIRTTQRYAHFVGKVMHDRVNTLSASFAPDKEKEKMA